MSKESEAELAGVAARLRTDGHVHSASIVERGLRDIANLKILLRTAYDIVDEELLPQCANMVVDFGRLNEFMIFAAPIKKELEDD